MRGPARQGARPLDERSALLNRSPDHGRGRGWRVFATHFRCWPGFALAVCGRPAPPAANSGVARVNVDSAGDSDADRVVYDLFTRQTGIEVRVTPAQGPQLADRLRREGARARLT